MRMTKTREMIGAIFAIVLVILFAAIATGLFGWNIPVLRDIANALGVGG